MDSQFDLTACDREPIHIPGAVQPHGVLLVLHPESLVIEQAGGPADRLFGRPAPLAQPLAELVDPAPLSLGGLGERPEFLGTVETGVPAPLDVIGHRMDGRLILEFEPAPERRHSAAAMARLVEDVTARFTAARSVGELSAVAVTAFRQVTGFDRVMIYRFLADESGSVLAEDKVEELQSFLNHRFPASDIPRQARQLYLRNVIRVIPHVDYVPGPMVATDDGAPPLDMSMASLRSVSPIHLQYLRNMGVGASASMSIVCDGALWGLVACHHRTARPLSVDERTTARLLAGALSQQVARLDEAELYRQRVRARNAEDELFALFARYPDLDNEGIARHAEGFLRVIPASGVALRRGDQLLVHGRAPAAADIHALCDFVASRDEDTVFVTDRLAEVYPPAAAFAALASGIVAATAPEAEAQVVWFRPEQVEVVEWAGNPHKPVEPGAAPGVLTPRKSFEVWRETVRGRSEPWSSVDAEAAARVARELDELHHARNLGRLNEALRRALGERDTLITQKDFLLREGNHRIQNSLQIVGSMLTMQLRQTEDPEVRHRLEEALGRVNAVSLVHRRLYRSGQPRLVDLEPYLRELVGDLVRSLGAGWDGNVQLRLSPVTAATDVATSVGLILTELVLNAAKYAYGGKPGPIIVSLDEATGHVVVRVADRGAWTAGAPTLGTGFGTRLVNGLVEGHGGSLERSPGSPGLTVTLRLPLGLKAPQGAGGS